VKSARSAYDGFFELPSIPPGRYTLRVQPAQAARLGLLAPQRTVQFLPSGTILAGISVILSRPPQVPDLADATRLDP
jgi:hypothetical protein